ncbi:hypothetical protein D4764_09G0007930 [Takifugu flavidus]|uniref:Uncharacterized protein n=1 Tax=Takifugu flavidus TaxID=433684 RepID=A0A5C6MLJ0_9TELE|nr:hypothetical protein D4764_09G0007930 [Takifugu flavidus]
MVTGFSFAVGPMISDPAHAQWRPDGGCGGVSAVHRSSPWWGWLVCSSLPIRMTCGHLTEPDPEVCAQRRRPRLAAWPRGLCVYLLPGPRPGYGRGSDGGATSGRFDPRRPR